MAKKGEKTANKPEKIKEPFRNKIFWALVYLLIITLLLIGGFLILREVILPPADYIPPEVTNSLVINTPSPTPTAAPEITPEPTPEPTPYVKLTPVMIYFDERQRQSVIWPVGLEDDGSIGTVNSAADCGWYEDGATPGDPGNAIIGGHIRWKGKLGTFSILHDMEVGEKVIIKMDNGELRYFYVISKNSYALSEFPSFVTDLDGDTRLTLITCLGDYGSDGRSQSRVVVVCEEDASQRQIPQDDAQLS